MTVIQEINAKIKEHRQAIVKLKEQCVLQKNKDIAKSVTEYIEDCLGSDDVIVSELAKVFRVSPNLIARTLRKLGFKCVICRDKAGISYKKYVISEEIVK